MKRSSGPLAILAMALLLTLGSGCAAILPPLTCPLSGGSPWNELDTPHFALKTDLPVAQARKLALDLEISRAALLAVLGAPADETAVPVQVIFFARESDYVGLGNPKGSGGYYSPQAYGDMEIRPTLVVHDDIRYTAWRALQHELTHQILRRRSGNLPWWLDEGLAETYSTLRVDGDEAVVGEAPRDVDYWAENYLAADTSLPVPKVWVPLTRAPSVAELAGATGETIVKEQRTAEYYLSAWKMVHVLRGHLNAGYASNFQKMLQGLMEGKMGIMAFADAYPSKSLGEFADAYKTYLLDRRDHATRMKFSVPSPGEPHVVLMPDTEVHALWAILRKDVKVGNAEIERALLEHPNDATLLLARAGLRSRRGDLYGARADLWSVPVTERETVQYLYFSLFNVFAFLEAEKDAEAWKIIGAGLAPLVGKLLPRATTSAQRYWTTSALLVLGRKSEALALSQKAIDADPSCTDCFEVYARALLSNKQFAAAGRAAERALILLSDGRSPKCLLDLYHRIESEAAKQASGPL